MAAIPGVAASGGGEKRPMTVEDLWKMQRIGTPALSPDGRRVAFTVTAFSMDDNKGNSDLWLVPYEGGEPRRLTYNEGSNGSPAWGPDGNRLAFVSKRGENDKPQIYLLSLEGGEAVPLTDLPIGVQDPKWFPDGRRIAFIASTWPDLNDDVEALKKRIEELEEDKVKVKISETRLVRYWDHYLTDGRIPHIFVVDVETGKVQDLMAGSRQLMSFWSVGGSWDISPDGSEIVYAADSVGPPYRSLNYDIYTIPAGGGEPRNRTSDNPAFDTEPSYSPDGRFILFGRNRRVEVAPDFTRLARIDRHTGEVMELALQLDAQPGGWKVTPDGDRVLFHAQDRGKTHLYDMPIMGGRPRIVVRGKTTGGVDVGPQGRLVYRLESITSPAELMAANLSGGKPRPLTAMNAERLAELDLGTVEDVTFTGASGDDVQMFVILPPGFDPGKKWPLLHLVHGGPHGAWRDAFHYRWNAALFASPGYVAAAVNFHGSTGSGQKFAESILGAHGGLPFTDIMKATDSLRKRGYIDHRRMAAVGGSYGGYLVSWILGHTNRFAALISHAGVYDLMGQFASDWTWGRPNNYGAAPWTNPGRVDRWSPSRFASSFKTPTLVIHGEKDYRVPYTQGLNLYGVLAGKGVPSRLVIFPDENHWILKPQSARVWWGEVFSWLDRYIAEEAGSGEVGGSGTPGGSAAAAAQ
jgi:dipeptidyl aminopeptidase/acylaminoacyl peptidase